MLIVLRSLGVLSVASLYPARNTDDYSFAGLWRVFLEVSWGVRPSPKIYSFEPPPWKEESAVGQPGYVVLYNKQNMSISINRAPCDPCSFLAGALINYYGTKRRL